MDETSDDESVTRLSHRDFEELLRLINDESTDPTPALRKAVREYQRQVVWEPDPKQSDPYDVC
jgi:hypothetical protein